MQGQLTPVRETRQLKQFGRLAGRQWTDDGLEQDCPEPLYPGYEMESAEYLGS